MDSYVQIRQITTIISSLFPLATLIIYAILPQLHNVHGLAIICNMACTIVTIFLSDILLAILPFVMHTSILCTITVCISHYFWLCTNSWLGVLCFDIFWTFRYGTKEEKEAWVTLIEKQDSKEMNNVTTSLTTEDEGPSNSTPERSGRPDQAGERRRFYKYSMFGWGMPLVLVAFAQILEHIETLPHWLIRPGFQDRCMFTFMGGLFYTMLPNMVVYCISLILVLIAACYLRGIDSNIRENAMPRVRAVILATLTSIIPWVAELYGWLSADDSAFFVGVIAEILAMILLFVFYVSQRHVLRLLYQRCLPVIRLWRRTVPAILACYCCDKYGRMESEESQL